MFSHEVNPQPLSVVCSSARNDEQLRDSLTSHLAGLRRQGLIEVWHEGLLEAGSESANEVHSRLDQADIVLALVSSDFLASDDCYQHQLLRLPA